MSAQNHPRTHLCIFGAQPADAGWLARVAAAVAHARIVLFDGSADSIAARDVERREIGAGDDANAVLRAAKEAFPGDDLILLRSGTRLPPYWFERISGALALADVLVASPLDNLDPLRSPLPEGADSDASVERVDALCFGYGRHLAIDWPAFSPLLSAWSGARLRDAPGQFANKYTLSQTLSPLRAVLLDHLYVADGRSRLRGPAPAAADADPLPPSPLGELREGVAHALAHGGRASAAYPGLDAKPVVLHVLHGWGGGAERFVRDLAGADADRHHLVLLARGNFYRRRYGETLELHDAFLSQPPLRRFDLPAAIASTSLGDPVYKAALDEIIRTYCVDAIVVSSLIGHSLDVLRSGLPCTYFVHDFYPMWPLLHANLDDPARKFDARELAADLARADAGFEFAERDAGYWLTLRQALAAALLAAHARLVAPSRAALDIFLRLQPGLRNLHGSVVPHGLETWWSTANAPPTRPTPADRRLRLIVLGRVRRGKASHLLRALLPALSEHAELFLVGGGPEAREFFGRNSVHVLINYRRDELAALLERIAPDAALILPDFAETFSYTLSELASLRIPAIATRLGALGERISDGVDGFLVDADAQAILATIARLRAQPAALAAVRATLAQVPLRTLDDMVQDYRDLLPADEHASPRYRIADAGLDRIAALVQAGLAGEGRRRATKLQAEAKALRQEVVQRGEWGIDLEHEVQRARMHATALENALLEHQQARREHEKIMHEQYDSLRAAHRRLEGEFNERTRWALALDAERSRLEAEAARMRGSLSWRMTRPLRYAARTLRGLRARAAFQLLRVRSAVARTRGSVARRGVSGTIARMADEFARRRVPQRRQLAVAPPTDEFAPFVLPTSTTPTVSIVVPVFNKIEYTIACLRSIAAHTGSAAYEVIVVDDCSSDASAETLGQIAGLRVHRNERNLGFVGSCNAGAALAQGEFVLFLNNDTQVTTGWLGALLRCFAEEPDAGLVGAKLVYPDGRLQEAGGIVFRDGSGWNYGRFDDPADPRYDFRREADYCSGAAIILRRALFDELGGFDARYAPAYYEDTDLAFAVRAAGKKVFYEPRSRVIHFEGVTAGTDLGAGMKQYQVVNRGKFVEKWRDALAAQPAPITLAREAPAAANFRARQRVLIVDAYTPEPDQDSGSLRMVNLMRLLRSLGYAISFMPDNRAHAGRYTEALQALGVEVLYHPYVSDLGSWLRDNGASLDAIVLSRHYVASKYVGLVRLYAPRAKLIFDTVDLHYLREERAAALSGSAAEERAAAATRRSELQLMRECDVTLVVSAAEKDLLARTVPNVRVAVLSNVHEIHGCRRGFAERKGLVFVGGFQHPPNIDAVRWYVREIHPLVRARAPHVEFHIIGSKITPEVTALAGEGVVVHGYVEDIAPFMDGCRLSLAPLRYGAGVKGKVNMAMSYGLPVVATATAVEGMHVRTDRDGAEPDVLVADSPREFADAILRAYGDEALWNKLSANGIENVRAHFSFVAALDALKAILPG